jgi:hypothetical protein
MTAGLCDCAMQVGVAICERYGQTGELARKFGRSSIDIPAMPDITDAQWCLPFRRQQAAAPGPVSPMAIGATKPQAITESTRLATIRRILLQNASTSPAYMTNALRDPISELFDRANPPTPDLYRVRNNRGIA